ncbi:MAG TPA: AAA family ATPase, partial [Gemmatimonadaceae bacterium]|nr:AAA family ATPase [Gemmatimonadaceae bacterium]
MATIHLHTLGQALIRCPRATISPDSEVTFAVALYLLLERHRAVPRDELVQVIWPGVPASLATHRLRQTLYVLRQAGATIEHGHAHLRLADGVNWDVDEFDASPAPGQAPATQGAFLPAYGVRLPTEFREWLDAWRARVDGRLRTTLVRALARARSSGDRGRLRELSVSLLRIDPLNEEGTLALAEATALDGQRDEALKILDAYSRELGRVPELVRLPAARLRERIATQFPAGTAAPSPLVGRGDLISHLTRAIHGASSGLPSIHLLHGPAGIGKTRLLDEVDAVAQLANISVARHRCRAGDSTRALALPVDTVRVLLALPGAIGCDPAALALLRGTLAADVSPNAACLDPDSASQMRRRLEDAALELFGALLDENALALLVDDVQ